MRRKEVFLEYDQFKNKWLQTTGKVEKQTQSPLANTEHQVTWEEQASPHGVSGFTMADQHHNPVIDVLNPPT